MVDSNGGIKILDFGIARVTSDMTQAGTQPGTILGTLNYMSPEQLTGKPVDHRTDIFSAGAVCYEILSGRAAFPGDVQTGVLHLILSQGPEPLARVCPELDREVVALVERCLARDLSERYPDLGAARRDLSAIRRHAEAGASAATIVMAPVPATSGRSRGQPGGHDCRGSRAAGHSARVPAAIERRDDRGASRIHPNAVGLRRNTCACGTGVWPSGRHRSGPRKTIAGNARDRRHRRHHRHRHNWLAVARRNNARGASAHSSRIRARDAAGRRRASRCAVPVSVRIDVSPWAQIDAIDLLADGKTTPVAFDRPLTTPCVVSLAPGRYHLKASNPLFRRSPLDADFTVTDGGQVLRFSLPGVKPEDLVKEIIK